ncbi:MAG: hypothetical protein KF802_01890 [Bdellovibrionaceae bacterium]|nr:hypothetical protein [Pseudobdellovibrionaceae bacterium]MBX3033932.1 hypothetical protein [Pseudobdellovibrionaceae bacterium]
MLRNALPLLLAFSLAACGGGDNPDRRAPAFEILNDGGLTKTGESYQGTGVLRSNEALSSSQSDNNFRLRFSLNDGGSLTLVAHADRHLRNGIEIRFQRTGTDLSIFVRVADRTVDWSEAFQEKSGIDASGEIVLSVDVHNGPTHHDYAHVLFWKNDEKDAFFDGAEDADGTPGKGRGDVWGLLLEDAVLMSKSVGPARDTH